MVFTELLGAWSGLQPIQTQDCTTILNCLSLLHSLAPLTAQDEHTQRSQHHKRVTWYRGDRISSSSDTPSLGLI